MTTSTPSQWIRAPTAAWASVCEGAPNMDLAYLSAKWRMTVQQVREVRFLNTFVSLTASCDCSTRRADCGRQAGGGERGQLGEHHHEQRSKGPDGQQQTADGGETSGQDPRDPLLQGEDHMVRGKRSAVS